VRPHVLDAHALMAFLEREKGFDTVAELFSEALTTNSRLLMTSVNVGEVLYMTLRECGAGRTAEVERVVSELPIEVVTVDLPLARKAAEYKATKRMSYADCFAAALAAQLKGPVVTGDPEFRAVEKGVEVIWLG